MRDATTHAFGIRIGYHEMEEQPLLGVRNLANLAITLFVPVPAIVCAFVLYRWFPVGAIPADPGLVWPSSADQAAALLLHHPVLAANVFFFLFVDMQFWVVALTQRSTWLIDPYWTLLPPLLALFFFTHPLADPNLARSALALSLLGVWSIRLTGSYFRREHWRFGYREDWRYAKMRRERPLFWLEQLVVVYLVQHLMLVGLSLPFFAIAFYDVPFGVLDVVLFVLAAAGILIARAADDQLDRFMAENAARQARGEPKIQVLDSGIWSASRHPNYFGEQLFWWSIAGFGLVCGVWWSMLGTAFNSCILAAVTSMTERRMMTVPERTEAFQAYRRRTSVWVPWWPRDRYRAATSSNGTNRASGVSISPSGSMKRQ